MSLNLHVGGPFSWKTTCACTYPKDILFINILEDGIKPIHNIKDKDGNLMVKDIDRIFSIDFTLEKHYPLDFSSSKKSDGTYPKHTAESDKMIVKWNSIIDGLIEDSCVDSAWVTGQKGGRRIGPFKTMVVDSLTNMFRLWKNDIMYVNRLQSLRIQDYGTLESVLFDQFLPQLKSIAENVVDWVVCIDHEDIEKDDLTGRIYEFPIGPSRAQGRKISKAFDNVFRHVVSGNKCTMHTRDEGRFSGSGSRLHLPATISPATFYEIEKHL